MPTEVDAAAAAVTEIPMRMVMVTTMTMMMMTTMKILIKMMTIISRTGDVPHQRLQPPPGSAASAFIHQLLLPPATWCRLSLMR